MKGTVKAKTHPVFTKRLDQLKEQAENLAKAFKGEAHRKWQLPNELEDKDLLDVPTLHLPPFDREPINSNYDDVVSSAASPGTSGDLVALKRQMDYNASEERAFRFRNATLVRCLTHGHGRRFGHSKDKGVFPTVRTEIDDIIQAGGKDGEHGGGSAEV